jgi:hypothetical protein
MDGWMDGHWMRNLKIDGWMDGWMDGHWVSYFNFYLSLAKTKQNCGLVICAH